MLFVLSCSVCLVWCYVSFSLVMGAWCLDFDPDCLGVLMVGIWAVLY